MQGFEDIYKILRQVAENQLKTDEQLARTDAQIAELRAAQKQTDAQIARIDAQIAELRAAQEKTDAQLAKTDAQLAKTDAQLAKTDAKLRETSKILGNIGINLGQTAEELFYHTFKKKPELAGIKFNEVLRHIYKKMGKLVGEFDLLLVNGDSVALIEIKHKVHPKDIAELHTRKLKTFRSLFPQYKHHKVYLAIGGMAIPAEVEEMAVEHGIGVLHQVGEVAKIKARNLKAY